MNFCIWLNNKTRVSCQQMQKKFQEINFIATSVQIKVFISQRDGIFSNIVNIFLFVIQIFTNETHSYINRKVSNLVIWRVVYERWLRF